MFKTKTGGYRMQYPGDKPDKHYPKKEMTEGFLHIDQMGGCTIEHLHIPYPVGDIP